MDGVVHHRGQLPRPLRAYRDGLDRVRPVAVAREHLPARVHELHRAPERGQTLGTGTLLFVIQ